MAKNNIIDVNLFGQEIGRLSLDEQSGRSSFQYNPAFLESNKWMNVFPETGVLKRTPHVQLFSQFDNTTFKGIPPQFADSLPDKFGSIIFQAWLESKEETEITVLEQLAYVANRGMGALEYSPAKVLPRNTTIDLEKIIAVLKDVLDLKKTTAEKELSAAALINIFKLGTSAGGARPKIVISESKEDGSIIPGDLEYSDSYKHYLVKLALDDEASYPREVVEFCYYQLLSQAGITTMPCHLIANKHFAIERFDRQEGKKQHVLSATGLTGWDFTATTDSSYENLFRLCNFLKVPHAQLEELYRRMVFNVIFHNTDDHLKNHSFIYDPIKDAWNLAPAYDVTFALNPLIAFKKTKRALAINGKRGAISEKDLLKVAEAFTIKNPKGIIKKITALLPVLENLMKQQQVPRAVAESIMDRLIKATL